MPISSGAFEAEKIIQPAPVEVRPVSIVQNGNEVAVSEIPDTVKQNTNSINTVISRQPAEQPSLMRAFSIEESDRKRFVRKIFMQDEHALTSALESLSSIPGWKEASRYIDEIFIRNSVDPYSPEAEQFIEILFQHYHPAK